MPRAEPQLRAEWQRRSLEWQRSPGQGRTRDRRRLNNWRYRTLRYAAWCCALLAALLVACAEPGPEQLLDDYLLRLARPLAESPPPTDVLEEEKLALRPPRWTALQIPIAPSAIDGLDFLKLRGCALQQTVARRNSSLGRMAPPSQRLLLELEFLSHVDACITHLQSESEDDLATLLREAADSKQRQLPALIFNASLGNEEYRDFWRAGPALDDYPAQTSSLVVDALEAISSAASRWLTGNYSTDDLDFELLLGDIATGDGGELLRALSVQNAYLHSASTMLLMRAQRAPLCERGMKPEAATILRTVASKYFVGRVQPWSATLSRRGHALLPPVRELELSLAEVLPEAYIRWRDAREKAFDEWSGAPRRHVSALQTLLGNCFSEFAPAAGEQRETR